MKKTFLNKRICILGDSITSHGFYIYDMRSYIRGATEKCTVYNRGTGGNRVDMAKALLIPPRFYKRGTLDKPNDRF